MSKCEEIRVDVFTCEQHSILKYSHYNLQQLVLQWDFSFLWTSFLHAYMINFITQKALSRVFKSL